MSKMEKAYNKFNLLREKNGLRTLSRREFVRALAMASTGAAYVPFLSCSNTARDSNPVNTAPTEQTQVPPQAGSTTTIEPITPAAGSTPVGGAGGYSQQSSGVGGATQEEDKKPPANAGSGAGGNGGGSTDKDPDPSKENSVPENNEPAIQPDGVTVGVSRNRDTSASVAAAIEAAGGLEEIMQGEKVFIKPNISISSPGGFTSLPVMRGIVQAVSTRTAPENITIAECTSMGGSTLSAAAASGYTRLVAELGINFLAFETQEYKLFKDPKWTSLSTQKRAPISVHPETKVYDHCILAPILKNHAMVNAWIPNCDVQFTCCMKLFVGILPYAGPGSRSDAADDIHTAKLGENVAELNCIIPKVTMCVVDATRIGIVGGPTPVGYANPDLIIASKDRVVCDSVAFATLKSYGKNTGQNYVRQPVWEQAQIKHGGELGLGITDPNKITIEPIDVDNMDEILAQWV